MTELGCAENEEVKANDVHSVMDGLLSFSRDMNVERSIRLDKSGERFNVFDVLNMTTNEVNCHSRFLHELLSPCGSHGMGNAFLTSFFEKVLDLPSEPWLADAAVRRERSFDDGRIDLLIEVRGKCCIAIEVKIYASDQPRQIARYAQYVNERKPGDQPDGNYRVYYLTLDGHEPSELSVGENGAKYACLSFEDDIVPWLESCVEASSSKPRLSEVIKQYVSVIEVLTGGAKADEELREVIGEVTRSPANYEAAAQIEKALYEGRTNLLTEIFSQIESHLCAELPDCDMTSEIERKDIEKYYARSGRNKPWPRLKFRLREDGNRILAFVVELDWRLYMGVVFFECDDSQIGFKRIDGERDWLDHLSGAPIWRSKVASAPEKDWWIDWCYLDDRSTEADSSADLIDFYNCTNGYSDLYDEAELDRRLFEWTKNIDNYLAEVKTWFE